MNTRISTPNAYGMQQRRVVTPSEMRVIVREESGDRVVLALGEFSPVAGNRAEIRLTPSQTIKLGHKLLQLGKHLKERSLREGRQFTETAAG